MERLTGLNALHYMGVQARTPPEFLIDKRAPTVNDYKDYFVGTFWLHMPDQDLWLLVAKTNNQGIWIKFAAGDVMRTLSDNIGTEVGPDVLGNIALTGVAPLKTTALPGAWTMHIETDGTLAVTYTTDSGNATAAASVLNVLGGLNIETSGLGNTVTVSTITLPEGVLFIDATGVFTSLGDGLDGQVLIAATGGDPIWGNITSTDTSVLIANGPNTIDLSVSSFPITGIGFYNIGMTVDVGATTMTIHSADGTAFSATNKGLISFASKATPGTFTRLEVTANVSMAWSDMDGNNMGSETAKAWADNMPIYVYAVMNEAEDALTFGLARMPHHGASGVLANIGTPAVANANSELSLFLFESVTIADYDDTPVVVLGSLKAQKAITTDAWTFLAVKGGDTGIDGFQYGTSFAFPPLQNGAVNNHMYVDAGTVPTWVDSHYNYGISNDGYLSIDFACNQLQVIGVSSGTTALWLMIPLSGTLVRRAGVGGVADQSVSVAAQRGIYDILYIDSLLANGYSGIQAIKNAGRRLRAGDFDTTNTFNAQYFGAHCYMMVNNQLP